MNERVSKLLANPAVVPSLVGLVAFGGGVGLGYILGQRRSQRFKVYTHTEEGIVESTGEHPTNRPRPVVVDEAYLASRNGQGLDQTVVVESEIKEEILEQIPPEESEPELVEENVFANNGDDEWNLEEQLAWRETHPDEPYVLHKDEFFGQDERYDGYLQHQLTFYNGDKILVPDDDPQNVIYDQRIVGDLKFGLGSGDENVVYIRNERHRAEYEVVLHQGHYAVEVQGMDDDDRDEIRHSQRNRLRD